MPQLVFQQLLSYPLPEIHTLHPQRLSLSYTPKVKVHYTQPPSPPLLILDTSKKLAKVRWNIKF